MAIETVTAGATPTVPAPTEAPPCQGDHLNAADAALSEINYRAEAVRFLLNQGGLFDLAAAEGTQTYSLITALDLLVKDIERNANSGIESVAAAMRLRGREASHG